MGYVHDTAMSQFIPPTVFGYSAGTWTLTVASNVWSLNRTAADASFTVYMPISIPSNSVAVKGAKLLSVEFLYQSPLLQLTTSRLRLLCFTWIHWPLLVHSTRLQRLQPQKTPGTTRTRNAWQLMSIA